MTVNAFLVNLGSVLTFLFNNVLPTITSAIASNGILLTVVILSLLSSLIFAVLSIIFAVIGKKGGVDD